MSKMGNTEPAPLIPVTFDIESEFKVRLGSSKSTGGGSQIKAYFGLRHSLDGWRYMLGIKIAGVKVKFPVYIIEKANSVSEDLAADYG